MLDVCPKKFLRDEENGAVMTIRDYGMLKEHQAMPVAGGVFEQSPTFIDAVEVLDDELATLRKANSPKG